jgi:hypothetical protein
MRFTIFLQTNCKCIQDLLEKLLKKKKVQKWPIEQELEKIFIKLIPLLIESLTNREKKDEYERQVLEKTSGLVQQIQRLTDQIAFIESLIQKLAQSPVEEIADDEQTFLIRLFLASKLSDPDSVIATLDGYLKNIGLMWNTIVLSLYRYIRVHLQLQNFVVRVFLFGLRQEKDFYETTSSGFVKFNVKSEKKIACKEIMDELIDDAKKESIEYRDTFQSMIYEFEIEHEQLKSYFLECSAQFVELISCFSSIDDFIFDGKKDSDSLNPLLDSLLAFESKFLSQKEKFTVFDRKFDKFLKETEDTLQAIFEMDSDSETSRFGDSHEHWESYKYDQPFPEIKTLIETTKGVLLNKCQKDCDCQPVTNLYDPRLKRSPHDPIVHKLVVLTPEMEQEISQRSLELNQILE